MFARGIQTAHPAKIEISIEGQSRRRSEQSGLAGLRRPRGGRLRLPIRTPGQSDPVEVGGPIDNVRSPLPTLPAVAGPAIRAQASSPNASRIGDTLVDTIAARGSVLARHRKGHRSRLPNGRGETATVWMSEPDTTSVRAGGSGRRPAAP